MGFAGAAAAGVAVGDGVGDGVAEGEGEGVAEGLGDGVGDGVGVVEGVLEPSLASFKTKSVGGLVKFPGWATKPKLVLALGERALFQAAPPMIYLFPVWLMMTPFQRLVICEGMVNSSRQLFSVLPVSLTTTTSACKPLPQSLARFKVALAEAEGRLRAMTVEAQNIPK